MAIWSAEQVVYVDTNKYEDKDGKYAKCQVSTMEKQREGAPKYSRWFAVFQGEAYQKISQNPNVKSFKVTMGKISNSPWTNADGEKVYPKYPTFHIYDVDGIRYNEEEDALF